MERDGAKRQRTVYLGFGRHTPIKKIAEAFATISAAVTLGAEGLKLAKTIRTLVKEVRGANEEANAICSELESTTNALDHFRRNMELEQANRVVNDKFFEEVRKTVDGCKKIFKDLAAVLEDALPGITSSQEGAQDFLIRKRDGFRWAFIKSDIVSAQRRLTEVKIEMQLKSITVIQLRLIEDDRRRQRMTQEAARRAVLERAMYSHEIKAKEIQKSIESRKVEVLGNAPVDNLGGALAESSVTQEAQTQKVDVQEEGHHREQANHGIPFEASRGKEKVSNSNLANNGGREGENTNGYLNTHATDMELPSSILSTHSRIGSVHEKTEIINDTEAEEVAKQGTESHTSPPFQDPQPEGNPGEQGHVSRLRDSDTRPGQRRGGVKPRFPWSDFFRRKTSLEIPNPRLTSNVDLRKDRFTYKAFMMSREEDRDGRLSLELRELPLTTPELRGLVELFRHRGKKVSDCWVRMSAEQFDAIEVCITACSNSMDRRLGPPIWSLAAVTIIPKRARQGDIKSIQLVFEHDEEGRVRGDPSWRPGTSRKGSRKISTHRDMPLEDQPPAQLISNGESVNHQGPSRYLPSGESGIYPAANEPSPIPLRPFRAMIPLRGDPPPVATPTRRLHGIPQVMSLGVPPVNFSETHDYPYSDHVSVMEAQSRARKAEEESKVRMEREYREEKKARAETEYKEEERTRAEREYKEEEKARAERKSREERKARRKAREEMEAKEEEKKAREEKQTRESMKARGRKETGENGKEERIYRDATFSDAEHIREPTKPDSELRERTAALPFPGVSGQPLALPPGLDPDVATYLSQYGNVNAFIEDEEGDDELVDHVSRQQGTNDRDADSHV